MKNIIPLLFILSFSNIVVAQNPYFLKEKDTVFITINDKAIEKGFFKIKFNNLRGSDGQYIGSEEIYNILDSMGIELLKKRERYTNLYLQKGILTGHNISAEQGLKFIHSNISSTYLMDSVSNKVGGIHRNFTEIYFNSIKNIKVEDSVVHDQLMYYPFRQYSYATSTLILKKEQFSNVTIFEFDGSTKKYTELKELIKKPHYFFLQDKVIESDGHKQYFFKEVIWKNNF